MYTVYKKMMGNAKDNAAQIAPCSGYVSCLHDELNSLVNYPALLYNLETVCGKW